MKTTTINFSCAPVGNRAWAWAVLILALCMDACRRWHERREAARHLQELDDRLLEDIGISRGDIRAAVNGKCRQRSR